MNWIFPNPTTKQNADRAKLHTYMVGCEFDPSMGFGYLSNWYVTSILGGTLMYTNQYQSIWSYTTPSLDQ